MVDPEEERDTIRTHQRLRHHHNRLSKDPSGVIRREKAYNPMVPDRSNASKSKNIVPVGYYKSENGEYCKPPPKFIDHNSQQQQQRPAKNNTMQTAPKRSPFNPPNNAESKHHKPSAFKLNPPRDGRSNSSIKDSTRLSSAFSRMLQSPVSFTSVSFHPDPNESSFPQWVERSDEDNCSTSNKRCQRHPQRGRQCHGESLDAPTPQGQSRYPPNKYQGSPCDVNSVAGSFFGEITPTPSEKRAFPHNEGEDEVNHGNGWARSNHHNETSSDPGLFVYPSQDYSTFNTQGVGLPNIVVLQSDQDDNDNPYLSPSCSSSRPPYCIGVRNAGLSHVNGVYLLALPKDEGGDADGPSPPPPPPLYFHDGPPVLLSDNRYYDLCILRIDCPDSPDHVIWFLARVDTDPSCREVKFSDCYYYCRMLRNDDGRGGEGDDGEPCRSPPATGWNVPKLPPGVEMLRITPEPGSSGGVSGVDADWTPREGGESLADPNDHSTDPNYDDQEMNFVSPGMDSGKGSSKTSKYSI